MLLAPWCLYPLTRSPCCKRGRRIFSFRSLPPFSHHFSHGFHLVLNLQSSSCWAILGNRCQIDRHKKTQNFQGNYAFREMPPQANMIHISICVYVYTYIYIHGSSTEGINPLKVVIRCWDGTLKLN